MGIAYSEEYSAEDYRAWDGDWELVRGKAYATAPSPSYEHQRINGKIFRQLDEQLDECTKCHAVIETDVQLSQDTVVRPDSMVVCYEPDEDRLTRAPSLVFEVISKSTAKRDEILKFDLYQSEAVPYYVLVYPDLRKAKVFELVDYSYKKIAELSTEIFSFDLDECSISLDFSLIWRKLK